MPVLEVEHLSKHFGGLKAVDDVSFDVPPRTITSLIGPNGAGKTTIFNLISGLLPLSSGTVRYERKAINGLSPQTIARLGVGRTFQEPRLFSSMTVLENVLIGSQRQSGENLVTALLRPPKMVREERENLEKAREILSFVGLADRAGDLAHNLSFGQQRFLSVARVLATDPQILLMDEPTVGLHPEEIKKLIGLMVKMVKERGGTILLIEHNMEVVMGVSDWIVLLVEGSVVVSGPPAEIKSNARLLEAYLGASYAASDAGTS